MLKAILFDFGGTLDCDGIPWKERFYPLYRDAGIDWDLSSFERFFYASDDSLTAEKLDAVGYEATILEQVNRVLRNGDSVRCDACPSYRGPVLFRIPALSKQEQASPSAAFGTLSSGDRVEFLWES